MAGEFLGDLRANGFLRIRLNGETLPIDDPGAARIGKHARLSVVVVNYLHRALLPHLLSALASDGTLLYETFAAGNEAYGRPTNADFLLQEGELLDTVRGRLIVVAFEQRLSPNRDKPAVVERIAAVGRARPWPPQL